MTYYVTINFKQRMVYFHDLIKFYVDYGVFLNMINLDNAIFG